MKVEFYKHSLGWDEKEAVNAVLDTIFLTTGDRVALFEEQFAAYLGAKYCVGLTSCTAALHLALIALGIGPGDEVITTPMTFVATSTAILHTGATPVWVDVEADTGNINADLIEAAVTPKTRAIIPVHLYGQMCDMRKIRQIADMYNLAIIEDAAHAIESERDGVRVGELADIACFSFYATKNITSGEGGAITTNSQKLAEKIQVLRLHGINREAADRYTKRYEHWDLIETGWKYNMDNIQAALLLPQLRKIDENLQQRQELYNIYTTAFKNIAGLQMPVKTPGSRHACHLFTIWVDPQFRDNILFDLQDRGIGVAVNYRSINLLTRFMQLFSKGRGSFPVSEKIGDSTLSLPFYPLLTTEQTNYVIDTVIKTIGTYKPGKE